jgi:putative oxidoreductase
MVKKLIQTNESTALTIVRIVLGLIIFPHGAQKLLGWFGGYGFNGTMGWFTGVLHLPWIVGLLVILLEFFGSLFLIFGIGTRIISIGFIGMFTGIILTAHRDNGFFMNWAGTQAGEGFEFHLLVIGMALTLLIGGAGKYSVDHSLQARLQ